jgi:hypothetical protein
MQMKHLTLDKFGNAAERLVLFAGILAMSILGFVVGKSVQGYESGATRLDAYQRCVSLMDHGAQWDESEDGWRCKVVTPGVER